MSDTAAPTAPSPSAIPSGRYRGWVLFMLVVVYTFNFIDRQIISTLATPIQAELGLSDTQLGLMSGLAFALFYTFLGIPVAMLADRRSRTWIMTIALAVWSGMTAICGLANNFTQMFFARLGVGAGEAGGVAPAYSLISDYFPAHQRARALSIYAFGIPIGSALGILLGGVIADVLSWRAAFFMVGIAGVLVAPIFRLTVREPKRGQYDQVKQTSIAAAPLKEVVSTISKKTSFWGLSFAAASGSMMGYGLFFWMPSFFNRSYADALPEFFSWLPSFLLPENPSTNLYAAYFFGTIVLIGGMIGIWLGGYLADKYGAKSKSAYALIPAWAFTLSIPFFVIGILATNLWLTFFVLLIPVALSMAWLGPVTSAFQHLVPPNMRATTSAVFLFINNLIGIGLGQFAIGFISDVFGSRYGDESLRYAMLAGTVFYVVAAGLFFLTAPRLKKDWHTE